jgi:peptide deformylase
VSIRPLRYLGDPILRTPSDEVTRFDTGLATLIEDLLDTVQQPGRAGLAANQIGSNLSAFSYNVDGQLGYLINPQIIEVSGDAPGLEACLSIPGVSASRHRSAAATAIGLRLDQQRVVVSGTGELARCLQHEIDHLKGRLFIDELDDEEHSRVMRQICAEQIAGGPSALASPSE